MEEIHVGKPGGGTSADDGIFEASWRAVYRNLRARARYLAHGDSARADDWLSCTALKALRLLRHAPQRIHNPQGFLFLVLQHVHIDSLRQEQREKQWFIPGAEEELNTVSTPHPSPLECLERHKDLEQLALALSRIPAQQQRLFSLMFIDEHTYPEIAAELGISYALARKRVQLLRDALKRLTKNSQK